MASLVGLNLNLDAQVTSGLAGGQYLALFVSGLTPVQRATRWPIKYHQSQEKRQDESGGSLQIVRSGSSPGHDHDRG